MLSRIGAAARREGSGSASPSRVRSCPATADDPAVAAVEAMPDGRGRLTGRKPAR
ncbi:MAG: hypothetical protein AAB368_10870 [bacterium]